MVLLFCLIMEKKKGLCYNQEQIKHKCGVAV